MRRVLWSALWLTMGGCAAATAPNGERYRGHFEQGFEVELFRACGEADAWWVTEGTELRRRYAEVAPAPYARVFVEVRGTLGPTGRVGHMGAYPREVAVTDVLAMRAARQDDCG